MRIVFGEFHPMREGTASSADYGFTESFVDVEPDEEHAPHLVLSRLLADCIVNDRAIRFVPVLSEQLVVVWREFDTRRVTFCEEAVRYAALWGSFPDCDAALGITVEDTLDSLVRFTEALLRYRHNEFHRHGRITPTKKVGRGQFPCNIEIIFLDAEIRRADRLRKLALEVTTRIEKRPARNITEEKP